MKRFNRPAVSNLLFILFLACAGMAFAQNPTVTGIAVIDSLNVDITFSKAMGPSALTPTHYAISGSGKGTLNVNPESVAPQAGNTYRLTWPDGDMQNHKSITITVTGVADSLGNPMGSPDSATLPTGGIGTPPTVLAIAAFDSQHIDVTFSERMDGSALVAGHYSLSGTGRGSLRATPDSVAALGGDVYRLAWTSGDQLNGADITIDVTGTTDDAGNSQAGPILVTAVGGAVGTLPTVSNVTVVDGLHVDVTFNEPMDNGSGVTAAGNYTLSGGGRGTLAPTPDSVAKGAGNTFRLAWKSGDMFNGGDITITVAGGLDVVGNPIGAPDNGTHLGGAIGSLPSISVFIVDDTARMTITFSEAVGVGVLAPANYTLSGNGRGSFAVHPDTVELRSNNSYRLRWNSGEMVNGGEVIVTVANVFDLASNPMGAPDFGAGVGIGTPPTLVGQSPLPNAFLQSLPSVQLTFSETVTSVTAQSLTVNGSAATSVLGNSPGPYTFSGFAPPAEGTATVNVVAGDIRDLAGNLFAAAGWMYSIDTTGPTVQSRVPATGARVNALASVQVTFGEAVTGVAAADLDVNGSGATGVAGTGAGPYIFTGFAQPVDGSANLTLAAGAIQDLAGNPFAGDAWTCALDTLPPTLQSRTPDTGAWIRSLPSVQVTFSEVVTVDTIAGLTVNGSAATAFSGSGTGPFTFTGFAAPPDGAVDIAIAAGAIHDSAGNPFAGSAWSATLDSTPPVSSASVARTTRAGTTTLLVGFTAGDTGAGVASTQLFVKTPGSGAFADSGLSQPGIGGSFAYTAATVNGLYQFATKATDLAGNAEPDPASPDATVLLNTVLNGPFTQPLTSGDNTLLFPMTDDLVVTITLTGATAGGSLTVSRATPVRASAPVYFEVPVLLLDEGLTIAADGLGAFTTATIRWPFDPANRPGAALDTAWEFNGQTLQKRYSPSLAGDVVTITGVTGFSTWYVGNLGAVSAAHGWMVH